MTRGVAHQEKIGADNVLYLRNTACGDVLANTLKNIVGHIRQNWCHRRARRYAVGCNGTVADLECETAREGQYRALGSCVVRETRGADIRELRGGVNNAAAILRIHHFQRGTRAKKRAAQVHSHQSVEVANLQRLDRAGMSDPCIVDQDIQGP